MLGLGCSSLRHTRALAAANDWHAALGRAARVSPRVLPGMSLLLELLRPASLEAIHNVARQFRLIHFPSPEVPPPSGAWLLVRGSVSQRMAQLRMQRARCARDQFDRR